MTGFVSHDPSFQRQAWPLKDLLRRRERQAIRCSCRFHDHLHLPVHEDDLNQSRVEQAASKLPRPERIDGGDGWIFIKLRFVVRRSSEVDVPSNTFGTLGVADTVFSGAPALPLRAGMPLPAAGTVSGMQQHARPQLRSRFGGSAKLVPFGNRRSYELNRFFQ